MPKIETDSRKSFAAKNKQTKKQQPQNNPTLNK